MTGGLRVKDGPRREKPAVSVVTVVFNAAASLEGTVQSVLGQDFGGLEYIIVDGGSTDGTLDIIRKYDSRLDYWVSEPDGGLYDAMNKGARAATGEWVNFMNAGDGFYRPDTVKTVMGDKDIAPDTAVIYGDYEYLYENGGARVRKAEGPGGLWKRMTFSHQASFTRLGLMKERPFNPRHRLAADFEFFFKTLAVDGLKAHYHGGPVARMAAGGLGDRKRVEGALERWEIARTYRNTLKVNLYFFFLVIDQWAKGLIKKLLPAGLVRAIVKRK